MRISNPEVFMQAALEQAEFAAGMGEVPIGAVLVKNEHIVATAYNTIEAEQDATAHAEIKLIKEASKSLGNWRLEDTSLFVTVEPCTMCIGGIRQARIPELYFGCYDEKFGAVGSLYDLSGKIKVFPEILAVQSKKLLRNFFSELRRRS